MRKHYPLNSNGAEDAGQLPWIDGVPSTGTQGSYPGHAIVTDTEAELLAAIDAAGLARNGSDLTQLIQAISRGIFLGVFTGSANALAGNIPNSIVLPGLLQGMRFAGVATSANTGGVTMALTGFNPAIGTLPLLRRDGAALQAGDLPLNTPFDFRYDGSAFRLSTPAPSETTQLVQTFVLNKPPALTLWVDPTNGSDANDGSLPGKAYKTFDAALNKTQNYSLFIYLLGDVTWSGRYNIYNAIFAQGVTADANGNITGFVNRGITLLGEASNSPTAQGRCNSGAFFYGPSLQLDHVYVTQPDSAAGLAVTSHFQILQGGTVAITASTIAPVSAGGAGTLIGSPSSQGGGYFTAGTILSGNCPGRLFAGVGAGGNPNALWNYRSNLTSA